MQFIYRVSIVLSVTVITMHGLYAQSPEADSLHTGGVNLLEHISNEDMAAMLWLNEPPDFKLVNNELTIIAPKGSDYFINPEDMTATSSAPFLYKEIAGDFVAIARVSPDLSSKWNAAGLFLMMDDTNWIKLVFESSDATGPSIVTVTTRGISDDANGVRLAENSTVWLKMIRKGNIYAMHWSEDGKNYKMARLSSMPPTEKVKIGLEAQSPVGEKAAHTFHHFSIDSKTVKDLRKGE